MPKTEFDSPEHPLGQESLRRVAGAFAISGPIDSIEPLGRGLINETFRVEAGRRHYVLQRINGTVFPDPHRIMANIRALDRHAKQREQLEHGVGLRVPALIETRQGDAGLLGTDGAIWRLMELIEDAVTLNRIDHPDQAREVGTLLGRFHTLVRSMPVETLGIALPGFHDTPAYLAGFKAVLSRVDASRNDAELDACIRFVMDRQALANRLADARDQGRIPLRVTHGDPKLDNLLFARTDGRGLALIDLDTLQPGLILQDVGDCLRSCCNRSGESADGRTGVSFDLAIAEPILRAYAEQTKGWLTEGEIDLMTEAIRLMPFELGLRFLTDHLEGDRYFKVAQRGENLHKAGIQFALVTDIESKAEAIKAMISRSFRITP
jgi:Ser/Thr protein kinase RdoA (MazF antagonist)